jgi:hypothetical protein
VEKDNEKTPTRGGKEKSLKRRAGMLKRSLAFILLVLMIPALSGCWYAAAAGAGAYVGYKAKEKGYKTQSPVTKEKQQDEEGKR